jgi:hypothetical protein
VTFSSSSTKAPAAATKAEPKAEESGHGASALPTGQLEHYGIRGAAHDGSAAAVQGAALPTGYLQFYGIANPAGSSDEIHAAAQEGLASGGGPLPHLDAIQRSFGPHDVTSTVAHVGDAATAAAGKMGAEAYATGNHVTFAGTPNLHTAAHEAAHVVQQRSGVHLYGGVGQAGDRYEQNADAVADRVVAGQSAADLLNDVTGGRSAGGNVQRQAVQRQVKVHDKVVDNLEDAWKEVKTRDPIKALDENGKATAKTTLSNWISASPKSSNPLATSENREYQRWEYLARALAGEVKSADNLSKETGLAQLTIATDSINAHVGAFITRLQAWHAGHENMHQPADQTKARYAYYYTSFWAMATKGMNTIGTALASPPSDLDGRITLAADYAVSMRRTGGWDAKMEAKQDAARKTHWNTDESAEWTKSARKRDIPLSAGPSATTGQLLTLATTIGASTEEKTALAWGIFAFFNQSLMLHESGTHRFHEVMAVAAGYGVPYKKWKYGEVPNLPGI